MQGLKQMLLQEQKYLENQKIKIKSDITIVQRIIVESIFRNQTNLYPKSLRKRLTTCR